MKAGLSTIQQTLTPEAAAVLNRSIAESAQRSHGQTTPLHVAAALLAAPSGLLRQACLRSHPTSSHHPLHTRALDLCFSVALDRLPSTNTSGEPPLSNALIAALKRAQAHQRRGCPEQQQQQQQQPPLLAVKIELDQLIISILDDPSVSRVMREASFSSPAVKATIEQSSIPPNSPPANLYMNPRLGSHDAQRSEEVKRVLEILSRTRKHNPVLVGDSDPDAVLREVLQRIERRELSAVEAPPLLRSAQVLSLEKEFASTDRSKIPSKIRDLGCLIETQIHTASPNCCGGVVLDLGDLKWIVESPGELGSPMAAYPIQQQTPRHIVAEIARLIARFEEGNSRSRVWVVGTATCTTYLRCQVYHPTMENDWGLQAVPIAPRSLLPGVLPRLGGNGIMRSSVEALATMGATTIPLIRNLCPLCTKSYELDVAKLGVKEFMNSSSGSTPETSQALPQLLQLATPGSAKSMTDELEIKEKELMSKQSAEELMKKWLDTCFRLHPNPHPVAIGSDASLSITRSISPIQLSMNHPTDPPGISVKTDLVLRPPENAPDTFSMEKTHRRRIKDSTGSIQDNYFEQQGSDFCIDSDSVKKLFKGLTDKVSWQLEAASAVAAAVMQCKSGNGKRRGVKPKNDLWLLFIGPDKIGKRKMVSTLSELVFGTRPVTVHLGIRQTDSDDAESGVNLRGKTPLDRFAEAVRQNPFSVIVLEDIDRADRIVLGTIISSIERGRLPDSHGREVGLGSAIFVLTANWLLDDLESSQDSRFRCEKNILELASSGFQSELPIEEKTGKRRAEWILKDDQPTKPRKESRGLGLSLDLNLSVTGDDDSGEGSRNSSDLTVEHEHEYGQLTAAPLLLLPLISELIELVDDVIVFKPVDFDPLRRRFLESISTNFTKIMGTGQSVQRYDDALDLMVGGVWIGGAAAGSRVGRVSSSSQHLAVLE